VDTLTQFRLLWLAALVIQVVLTLGVMLALSSLVRLRNRAPIEGARHSGTRMGPILRSRAKVS